jgi:hypothetical protein
MIKKEILGKMPHYNEYIDYLDKIKQKENKKNMEERENRIRVKSAKSVAVLEGIDDAVLAESDRDTPTGTREATTNKEDEKDECVFMVNKEQGANYANCDGMYERDNNHIVNSQGAFVNKKKARFIAWSNGGWILTGTEWLEDIVLQSDGKTDHYFGGFHASTNSDNSIESSHWDNYTVSRYSASAVNVAITSLRQTLKSLRDDFGDSFGVTKDVTKLEKVMERCAFDSIPDYIINYIIENTDVSVA